MSPAPRLVAPLAIALATAGCAAETLDAGSTTTPPAPATRATMGAMIDAITMDATDLYFTCEDGWVYRLAKTGASPPVKVAPVHGSGSLYTEGIAVDDDGVYWTTLGDGLDGGAVFRAPKTGGSALLLAGSEARPWSIAVDGDHVVWAAQGAARASNGAGGIGKGTIERVDKLGRGEVEVLAGSLDAPDYLTLDGDGAIYWHEAQAIRRMVPGGTASTILERPVPFKTTNLVSGGGRVAWADDPSGVASVWSADAAGATKALASDVDPPASLAWAGATVFWNVATGGDVGAIDAAGDDDPRTILARDAFGDRPNERALFLLADEHAFYWVVSWESRELTVAIRVLER